MSLLDSALRLLYSRYVPEPVRNSLRLRLLLLQQDREPVLTPPPLGRVAVLAPHMDDEVFGCGGTLARAAAGGSTVTPIFLTDGSKGYDTSRLRGRPPAEVQAFQTELVQRRKDESRRAAKILGYGDALYLDLPDGALAATADAVGRLAGVLRRLDPNVVLLPFLTDIHHDHWLTNVIFARAAAEAGLRPELACWGYEVWIPVPANAVVDVTGVFPLKSRAMLEFASQDQYDYRRTMAALNTYRSVFSDHGAGFAEGFYVTDLALYLRLYHAIAVGRGLTPA